MPKSKEEQLLKLLNVATVKDAIENGDPHKCPSYLPKSVGELIDSLEGDFDYGFSQVIEFIECKARDQVAEYARRLVPSEGTCDTLAGELYRAALKLDYRYYNDGDGPKNTSTSGPTNFLLKKVDEVNEIFTWALSENFPANLYNPDSFVKFVDFYQEHRVIPVSLSRDYKNDLRDLVGDIALIAYAMDVLGLNQENSEDMLSCD